MWHANLGKDVVMDETLDASNGNGNSSGFYPFSKIVYDEDNKLSLSSCFK